MKLIKLSRRLPHLLTGGLLAGILAASFTVLPAPPAHAADQYLIDFSISEDLSFQQSFYLGKKKDFSEEYETEDSNKICEKLKSQQQQLLKEHKQAYKRQLGIINQKVDNCTFQGSLFFIETSGKTDEKLLKNPTLISRLKIKNQNELEFIFAIPISQWFSELDKIAKQENIGIMRYTFPGKIKRVTPDIGKISGNSWSIDKSLTSAERDKLERSEGKITITAERYGSNLGLILGITIPAALIIAAVILLLIVRCNRKKKQPDMLPYPAGNDVYPPQPFIPNNPAQGSTPGYPAAPGAPGMPGATPYPPNIPPQGQPAAPVPGGYYPYQYPYPPANPQGSQAGYPVPPQSYGAPTPGFPPPAAPPQPAAGQPGNPEDSNQVPPAEQPEQEK